MQTSVGIKYGVPELLPNYSRNANLPNDPVVYICLCVSLDLLPCYNRRTVSPVMVGLLPLVRRTNYEKSSVFTVDCFNCVCRLCS